MHIDDIIRRVKAEADTYSTTAVETDPEGLRAPRQAGLEVKDRYHVRELLAIEGDALVTAAYRCLLRREPDPSADIYLQKLKTGAMTPVAFIGKLRFSAEGRKLGVKVDGLVPRLVYSSLQQIPLLGYVFDIGVTILRLPTVRRGIKEDLDFLKAKMTTKAELNELERVAREQRADRSVLERKADRDAMERKADRSEVLAYKEAVRYAELYFRGVNQELQELLGELKKELPATAGQEGPTVHERTAALSEGLYDKLYMDFEALYRGTQQEISEALSAYTDLFPSPAPSTTAPPKAIDLGSGRGEMIRCLNRHGFDTTGVDLNRVAVMACQEEGLNAVHADVLSYLEDVEPDSAAVMTSLHLVEHLSHGDLFLLLQAALKTLAPGGMLLLETPNPRNLLVGAGDFYRDFTHIKPLFPDTLRFLLDYFGYTRTEIFFFEDADGRGRKRVPAGEIRFDELNDYLNISRDYAVVGYKRCG